MWRKALQVVAIVGVVVLRSLPASASLADGDAAVVTSINAQTVAQETQAAARWTQNMAYWAEQIHNAAETAQYARDQYRVMKERAEQLQSGDFSSITGSDDGDWLDKTVSITGMASNAASTLDNSFVAVTNAKQAIESRKSWNAMKAECDAQGAWGEDGLDNKGREVRVTGQDGYRSLKSGGKYEYVTCKSIYDQQRDLKSYEANKRLVGQVIGGLAQTGHRGLDIAENIKQLQAMSRGLGTGQTLAAAQIGNDLLTNLNDQVNTLTELQKTIVVLQAQAENARIEREMTEEAEQQAERERTLKYLKNFTENPLDDCYVERNGQKVIRASKCITGAGTTDAALRGSGSSVIGRSIGGLNLITMLSGGGEGQAQKAGGVAKLLMRLVLGFAILMMGYRVMVSGQQMPEIRGMGGRLIFTMIVVGILDNAGSFVGSIVGFAESIGTSVAGDASRAGDYDPLNVILGGVNIGMNMVGNHFKSLASTGIWSLNAMSLGATFMALACGIAVVIVFAIVALQIVVTKYIVMLTLSLGLIVLAFTPLKEWDEYSRGYMRAVMVGALSIITMYALYGFAMVTADYWNDKFYRIGIEAMAAAEGKGIPGQIAGAVGLQTDRLWFYFLVFVSVLVLGFVALKADTIPMQFLGGGAAPASAGGLIGAGLGAANMAKGGMAGGVAGAMAGGGAAALMTMFGNTMKDSVAAGVKEGMSGGQGGDAAGGAAAGGGTAPAASQAPAPGLGGGGKSGN